MPMPCVLVPVVDELPLTWVTTELLDGRVGHVYQAALTAAGGQGAYQWALIDGQLPAGLQLSAEGLIQGTPIMAESQSFTVEVRDDTAAQRQTLNLSITGAVEVIVDNTDTDAYATGQWYQSSAAGGYQGQSVYSDADATFRWAPTLAAGHYEVYVWWTYHTNRHDQVPYRIHHSNGVDTITVNQHDPALSGQWNRLGTYHFDGSSVVEISSENGQANADAVRWLPIQ